MGTSIFKAAARDAAQGHALSSKKLVNAPVSKRKAGYPNTYAAFEGAPVVKDGARFAELDGEALALVYDYKVGSVLFQRGILSTIRSVQSSFREAFFSRLRRRFSPLSERHPSFALDGGSALFQRGILLLHVPSDQAQEHPAPTDTSANSSKKPSSSLRPPFDHACHLMPPDDAPPRVSLGSNELVLRASKFATLPSSGLAPNAVAPQPQLPIQFLVEPIAFPSPLNSITSDTPFVGTAFGCAAAAFLRVRANHLPDTGSPPAAAPMSAAIVAPLAVAAEDKLFAYGDLHLNLERWWRWCRLRPPLPQ